MACLHFQYMSFIMHFLNVCISIQKGYLEFLCYCYNCSSNSMQVLTNQVIVGKSFQAAALQWARDSPAFNSLNQAPPSLSPISCSVPQCMSILYFRGSHIYQIIHHTCLTITQYSLSSQEHGIHISAPPFI